jgi:hypothetical protein
MDMVVIVKAGENCLVCFRYAQEDLLARLIKIAMMKSQEVGPISISSNECGERLRVGGDIAFDWPHSRNNMRLLFVPRGDKAVFLWQEAC